MARILKIYSVGGGSVTELYDLIGSDLCAEWRSRNSIESDGLITTTWDLVISGTAANVRQAYTDLEDALNLVNDYRKWRKNGWDSIWLYDYSDGETAKRTLIYNYELAPLERMVTISGITNNFLRAGLAITHSAAWESTTTFTDTGTIEPGQSINIADTSQVNGRVLSLEVDTVGVLGGASEMWAGILPGGVPAATFAPRISLYTLANTFLYGADTAISPDANGYNGNIVQTTFTTDATLKERFSVTETINVSSRPPGNYIAVLRYSTPTIGSFGVVLGIGEDTSPTTYGGETIFNFQKTPEKYLETTATTYDYVSLGRISVLDETDITIYAARYSVAGIMNFDQLYLIPSDNYVHVPAINADTTTVLTVYTDPTREVTFDNIPALSGIQIDKGNPEAVDWSVPNEGGALTVVWNSAANDATQTAAVELIAYKRYKEYRSD